MKIVNICIGAVYTEGYTYQDNLLPEYQRKLGYDVTVITSVYAWGNDGKKVIVEPCEKVLDNGIKLIRLRKQNKLNSFLGYYSNLYKLLKKLQPDFVYVHGLCLSVMSQVIKYKKKTKNKIVKIVADNHQDYANTKVGKFISKLQITYFKAKWRSWINYIDKVYAVTSWRKTFANEVYGIPNDKLDVLVMGVDNDDLPKDFDATRKEIRESLKLSNDAFTFITGGKLDKRKNVIEMMKAFTKLKDENAVLVLFGSVAEEIKNEFNFLLENDKRIKYIGYLSSSEIKKYFIASDFGVFAGSHSVLWEEAIGCSLPCLFKKVEEIDHVEACGNAISLKEPTVENIYEALNKVISDKDYYNSLKEASIKASKEFSYTEIAKKSIECVTENKE